MATAKYLLRAPAEDMARWRDRAVARGKSFAEHIRDCLTVDERLTRIPEGTTLVLERLPVEAAPVTGGGLGPGAGAASTGDVLEPPERVPSPPPVVSPVDLQEQARRLAERMKQR